MQSSLDLLNTELEQEREKRLLKSRLVAMFSHDFRNPLTAILSSIELLRMYDERLTPERRRTHLDRMESSSRQLLQMLEDMLIVAQMESGQLECNLESVDVTALVQKIVSEFEFVYHRTHTLRFDSTIQHYLALDPKLFRQIVTNLISNAVKYSPKDSTITVSLTDSEEWIEIAVQDQGIGIPEEDIPHLFEPFHRADNAKSHKGTGLGLSIVKQAAEVCGGSVRVESVLEQGSRFIVRYPNNHEK